MGKNSNQIRSGFTAAQVAIIDQQRGALSRAQWVREHLVGLLANRGWEGLPVLSADDTPATVRVCPLLGDDALIKLDKARGTVPRGRWVQDVIGRLLAA